MYKHEGVVEARGRGSKDVLDIDGGSHLIVCASEATKIDDNPEAASGPQDDYQIAILEALLEVIQVL